MDGGAFVQTGPGLTLLQAFAPDVDNQTSISFGAASASAALPTGSKAFRLHADQACFIDFGNGSATATSGSMPFDAGTEIISVPASKGMLQFRTPQAVR